MSRVITENGITFLRDEWSVDDVRGLIEDNEIEGAENFTDEDCIAVLHIIDRSHDANVGINWEVIGCAVDYYLQEKTE
jgi:hypothetical protein